MHRPAQPGSRPTPAVSALALVATLLLPAHPARAAGPAEPPPAWWPAWLQLQADQPRLVEPTWGPGEVSLQHADGRLRVTLSAALAVGVKGAVEVALVGGGGAVREVTYAGSAADWLVRGGMVVLRLDADAARRGTVTVASEWPLDVATGQAVVVPLPAWPQAKVTDGGAELDVAGPGADGQMGSETRALLVRGPASTAPRIRAARYRMTLRPGAADVELRVEVEARGSEGTIDLAPRALALVDVAVDGKPVAPLADEDQHQVAVTGRGLRVITARLQVATTGEAADQRAELGRVAAPITEVEVRAAGKRAIRFEPEAPVQSRFAGGQTVVHGFLPPGDTLQVAFSVEGDAAVERTVRFSAETWQVLTLDEGLVRGKASLNLSIVQGKATAVHVALPDDVVVAGVEGAEVATWDVLAPTADLPRRIRVGLTDPGESGTGPVARKITVTFERAATREAGSALEVPVLRPIGAFRESGAVVLLDGDKVGFAPLEGAQGWVRAGLEALPADVRRELDGRADQVWRHIGPPSRLTTKVAAARVREVRLEASGTALVRIDERALRANHVVVVEVKAGRTDKLYLDLPATVGEPRVVAPSLSRVAAAEGLTPDQGRKLWELRFSTALEGSIQLQIDLEQLIASNLTRLALPDVKVRGAEVEVGVLALSAEAGLELVPSAKGETRPVPTTELPEALARQAGRDLVAGFRSPRGPVQVEVGLQRRATVATLDAFARQVWLESHVLGDGRIASRAVVLVQSAGRPVLRVTLPPGADVLALTVDGGHVKAVRDDKGGLAVPLGGGAAVRVEIRYEQRGDGLGLVGRLVLEAPRFDVRQGPLSWLLRLPGDRQTLALDTALRRADGETVTPPPAPGKDDLVPLPVPHDFRELRFAAEVRDAGALATIELWLGRPVPLALGWLLLLAGFAAGGLAWRGTRRRRELTVAALVLGGLGLVALVAAEGLATVLLLAAAGVALAVGLRLLGQRRRAVQQREAVLRDPVPARPPVPPPPPPAGPQADEPEDRP